MGEKTQASQDAQSFDGHRAGESETKHKCLNGRPNTSVCKNTQSLVGHRESSVAKSTQSLGEDREHSERSRAKK